MPPRKVDDKKTRKALRKLRRAVEKAAENAGEGDDGAKLSDWEKEFAQSVEQRLEKFGSAFRDASKGKLDEPLSARQNAKLSEIAKKARGRKTEKGGGGLKRSAPIGEKKRSTFKPKTPKRASRDRDIYDDVRDEGAPPDEAAPERPAGPPRLRVVKGGKKDEP